MSLLTLFVSLFWGAPDSTQWGKNQAEVGIWEEIACVWMGGVVMETKVGLEPREDTVGGRSVKARLGIQFRVVHLQAGTGTELYLRSLEGLVCAASTGRGDSKQHAFCWKVSINKTAWKGKKVEFPRSRIVEAPDIFGCFGAASTGAETQSFCPQGSLLALLWGLDVMLGITRKHTPYMLNDHFRPRYF